MFCDAILIDSVHLFFSNTQVEEVYNYEMHFLKKITEFIPKNGITPHISTKSFVMT